MGKQEWPRFGLFQRIWIAFLFLGSAWLPGAVLFIALAGNWKLDTGPDQWVFWFTLSHTGLSALCVLSMFFRRDLFFGLFCLLFAVATAVSAVSGKVLSIDGSDFAQPFHLSMLLPKLVVIALSVWILKIDMGSVGRIFWRP